MIIRSTTAMQYCPQLFIIYAATDPNITIFPLPPKNVDRGLVQYLDENYISLLSLIFHKVKTTWRPRPVLP